MQYPATARHENTNQEMRMMIAAVILPKVARIRTATNGLVISSAKPDRRHKQSQVDSSAAKSQKTKELKRWHCQGGTDLKQMCSALKKRSPVPELEAKARSSIKQQ